MSLNEILVSIGAGLFSGFFASAAFWWAQGFLTNRNNKRLFGGLAGTYHGYVYSEGTKVIHFDQPVSTAQLTHLGGRLLEINVTHLSKRAGHNSWVGTISMSSEYESMGDIAWHYLTFEQGERHFGFKRIIVKREFDEFWLLGEGVFHEEIFARVGSKPHMPEQSVVESTTPATKP